ncbi:MAG: type I restriction-modification system subunit M N-terminal domain-containing protein, partial [Pseudonocardiaceae bacterium]
MSTSTPGKIKNHAAFIWSVADLLRGDYKQSEYGKVILPLTVIRRLDCVLEPTKNKVLAQEHCPIGDLLGPDKESQHLEYKSTLRIMATTGERYKPLETATLKTVAAFANSRDGGTLLIGVSDDGSVFGLASDYASMRKPGKDDRDLFQLCLGDLIASSMGAAVASNVSSSIHTVDGADV